MSKRRRRNRATGPRKPRILVLGHSAGEKIRKAGGEPVFLDQHDERAEQAAEHENIHGLLLLGGGDVDPALYGQNPGRHTYGIDEQRDLVEMCALEAARDRGLPVLGICRGAQLMNVVAGGTLHQHVPDVPGSHSHHRGGDHRVKAVKGSRLANAWRTDEQWVISIHHQAVKDLAPGFVATGFGHDGIVEAIESVDGWELGVQFHPEMSENDAHQRIFDRFVYACAKKAGLPCPRREDGYKRPSRQPRPARAPQRKPANVTRLPRTVSDLRDGKTYQGTWGGPVSVSWRCFGGCRNMRFDEEQDYLDHMVLLHGYDLEMVER